MISRTPDVAVLRRPVAAIGFLVAMVDGYDTLMLAFIAPLISKEWALHPEIVGAIFASSYAAQRWAPRQSALQPIDSAARPCCSRRSRSSQYSPCSARSP